MLHTDYEPIPLAERFDHGDQEFIEDLKAWVFGDVEHFGYEGLDAEAQERRMDDIAKGLYQDFYDSGNPNRITDEAASFAVTNAEDEVLDMREEVLSSPEPPAHDTLFKLFGAYSNLLRLPERYIDDVEIYIAARDIFEIGATLAARQGDQDQLQLWRDVWSRETRHGDFRDRLREEDGRLDSRRECLLEYLYEPETRAETLEDVIRLAQAEETVYGEEELSVEYLVNLLKEVESTPLEQRYDIVLQPHGDKLLFDVLGSMSSKPLARNIQRTVSSIRKPNQAIDQPGHFRHAIDLGAGTGQTTEVVASARKEDFVIDEVTLIDSNQSMIDTFVDNNQHENWRAVRADASKLPIVDKSTDLIYSQGMIFHMSREQVEGLFTEVERVLEDDGVYINVYTEGVDRRNMPQSWREVLRDIIGSNVTGRLDREDTTDVDEQNQIAREHGLTVTEMTHDSTRMRVFSKGALTDNGMSYHNGHHPVTVFST